MLTAASSLFAWNVELFERINASATTPYWLVAVVIAIAQWVIWLVPAWLVLSWFRADSRGRRDLLEVLAVMLLALGLGQLIVIAWPQPRPFMVHLGSQFVAHVPDPGFPSDHVTVFWSAACAALGLAPFSAHGTTVVRAWTVGGLEQGVPGSSFPARCVGRTARGRPGGAERARPASANAADLRRSGEPVGPNFCRLAEDMTRMLSSYSEPVT